MPAPNDSKACHGKVVKESEALHPGCIFPITSPRMKVMPPCVFSSTGWVIRPLPVKELVAFCDIQDSLTNSMGETSSTCAAMTDIPFVLSPPAKLLGTFVDHLDQSEELQSQPQLEKKLAPSPAECEDRKNCEHVLAENPNPDLLLIFGRTKVAKNDDASVNFDYWDLTITTLWEKDENFPECEHAFDSAFAFLPMDSIRKLALRVWKHCIWKSLQRHLHRTYEPDWADWRTELQTSSLECTLTAARECICQCMGLD